MNTILRVDGGGLWQLAGWTMLHFAWIGSGHRRRSICVLVSYATSAGRMCGTSSRSAAS